MLANTYLIEGYSAANATIICTARLSRTSDGIYPDVSAFSSGSYSVTDISTYPATEIINNSPLSPISNYLISYPQSSLGWQQDEIGLNFFLYISGYNFSSSNHVYLIVVNLITVDGNSIYINF